MKSTPHIAMRSDFTIFPTSIGCGSEHRISPDLRHKIEGGIANGVAAIHAEFRTTTVVVAGRSTKGETTMPNRGQNDPRLQPLIDAAIKTIGDNNYDPHFSGIAERAFMESVLFLARYDALMAWQLERDGSILIGSGMRHIPRIPEPISMILFCPSCGVQHIEPRTSAPHRSHICVSCSHVWRPADVPTTGVAEIATVGSMDDPKICGLIAILQNPVVDG